MSDRADTNPPRQRTAAVTKKSWWPGWIWAVPIAALAIVGWLVLREIATGGVDITVTFEDGSGLQANQSKVLYRGIPIGSVTDVALAKDGKQVIAKININDAQKTALTSGTHFYLETATLSNPATFKSILAGPSITMVPGAGTPQRHFVGIVGSPPPQLAAAVPYTVHFEGAVGNLKIGAPVTLRGFTVGDVDDVRLVVDPHTGAIATPVILLLDPTRFNIGAPPANGNWTPMMNAAMAKLVAEGLRASLTQTPPLVGAEQVELQMVPNAGKDSLRVAGNDPEIPAAGGGGGIENLANELGKLPLAEIGNNVEAITAHVRDLVSSPQLTGTLDHLNRTVAELDKTVATAGPEIDKAVAQTGPQIAPTVRSVRETVESLRKTASELDETAQAVRNMTGGTPTAPNGNLKQALNELTETGRAVRTLANYLDAHPEALLRGR